MIFFLELTQGLKHKNTHTKRKMVPPLKMTLFIVYSVLFVYLFIDIVALLQSVHKKRSFRMGFVLLLAVRFLSDLDDAAHTHTPPLSYGQGIDRYFGSYVQFIHLIMLYGRKYYFGVHFPFKPRRSHFFSCTWCSIAISLTRTFSNINTRTQVQSLID